jgi:hypothetical protein
MEKNKKEKIDRIINTIEKQNRLRILQPKVRKLAAFIIYLIQSMNLYEYTTTVQSGRTVYINVFTKNKTAKRIRVSNHSWSYEKYDLLVLVHDYDKEEIIKFLKGIKNEDN